MPVTTANTAPLTIMIDGLCPLCKREGAMLMRMDRGRGLIRLLDITAPDFDASSYGLTSDQVMGSIHALTPQGTIVNGMEVFRLAYARLGWGWLWAPTAGPSSSPSAIASIASSRAIARASPRPLAARLAPPIAAEFSPLSSRGRRH
jgi:predicted DCC family thiol-disulfide oxidoreductase YuxK